MTPFNFSTTNAEVLEAFRDEVKGKTIMITGPTEGSLGAQSALCFATGNPAEIILAGRNHAKIESVIASINLKYPDISVTFVQVELASLSSVRKAAKQISILVDHIDILINNAGVMAVKDFTISSDGIELQFAINHLSHFLLTNLILPKILAAPKGARIVNLTSDAYTLSGVRFQDINFHNGDAYNPFLAYGQSKTANILFTEALAKRIAGTDVVVLAANPGMVPGTGLTAGRTPEMAHDGYRLYTEANGGVPPVIRQKDAAASCSTVLVAALDPSLSGFSGAYLRDCVLSSEPLREHATGYDKGEKLWSLSEQLVGEKF
ncbi:short-chain dehydrogenase [Xylogone sp. PMI_703]|nr:short-chain dehydrogenase [Xylogone sp. PMI_703]